MKDILIRKAALAIIRAGMGSMHPELGADDDFLVDEHDLKRGEAAVDAVIFAIANNHTKGEEA